MKNVLDKRQLGYKVTANSLYGQCGGVNYSGSTSCVYGLTCCQQSIWYSQCLFSC